MTVTVPLKEVSRLPELFSASTVRPKGLPAVTLLGGGWVTTRLVVARVARPIESVPVSPNQRLPSGPIVISPGPEFAKGMGYSVTMWLAGLIVPICPMPCSPVEQMRRGTR